jgi:hypothetical protein
MEKRAIDCAKALVRLSEVTIFELRGEWRVNRLEFDRELAGYERSDEIAQPMAEPFTELTGKRRLFG